MWTTGIGGESYGPDIMGRDRHRVALNRLFKEAGPRDFGSAGLHPCFGFTSGGPFSKYPILDGVLGVRVYVRHLHVGVDIGISETTQLGSDEKYREKLIELMKSATERLIKHVAKKKLEFDAEAFSSLVDEVLTKYAALELPLPPTPAELNLAHRWLGIPKEDLGE